MAIRCVTVGVPRRASRTRRRVAGWPMTTLSTHDTTRSEDARARLAVLSEIPDRWADRFSTWGPGAPPARRVAGAARLAEPDRGVADHRRAVSVPTWARPRRRRSWSPSTSTRCPKWTQKSPRGPAGPRRSRHRRPDRTLRRRHPGARGGRTRWGRSCCSWPGQGSPTSTREPSASSTHWSTPTTGGPSTGTRYATWCGVSTAMAAQRRSPTTCGGWPPRTGWAPPTETSGVARCRWTPTSWSGSSGCSRSTRAPRRSASGVGEAGRTRAVGGPAPDSRGAGGRATPAVARGRGPGGRGWLTTGAA